MEYNGHVANEQKNLKKAKVAQEDRKRRLL